MGIKKGFNEYEIRGEETTIFLCNRKNEIVGETIIDTKNLSKLIELDLSWHNDGVNCGIYDYYITATQYLGAINGKPTYTTHKLHSIIMNTRSRKAHVDHIDHDTHNNKESNLRIITVPQNTRHRKGLNSNNLSGCRNVCWSKGDEKWLVQLQVDGKNKVLGKFPKEDLATAIEFADIKRKEIYGIS